MKTYDLSMIMRRAWQIARATGKAFAAALSQSWLLYRLTKRMRGGIVRFVYQKTDGTLRTAFGTLQNAADLVKGAARAADGRTVRYYDVEAAGWRSFRGENFLAY